MPLTAARPCTPSHLERGQGRANVRRALARFRVMLETGATAPDFTLPDQNGEPITLSSSRGRPVVLDFYPKADTPG